MTKPSRQPVTEDEEIVGPAVIGCTHARDRDIKLVGGRKAWRNLSPLQRADKRGQLVDKALMDDPKTREAEEINGVARYSAGDQFTELWLMGDPETIPGSGDLSRVRVAGSKLPWAEFQHQARIELRRIEVALGVNDYMILRRVCGEGYEIAETVKQISPAYRDATLIRFREALDALRQVMAS